MAKNEFFVLLLTIICVSFISATRTCLRSRLEHYPCTYRHSRTAKPRINQVGQYFTSFRRGPCEIREKGHRVQNIPKVAALNGSIFYLYSPGKNYQTSKKYYNRNLVFYNVTCSPGQYIYFQVHQMNMQSSKCYDDTVGRSKCIDYIQVNTAQGDTISDNCGTDKSDLDGEVFPFDSIQVIFRSNHKSTSSGFYATAQCFTPVQSSPDGAARCSSPPSQKSQATTRNECQSTSHEEIRVPYGHQIRITSSSRLTSISIVNNLNNEVIRRIDKPSIRTLSFHSMDGNVQRFENNYAPLPSQPIERRFEPFRDPSAVYLSPNILRIPSELQGPGFLYLPRYTSSSHICFRNYLVDVSSLLPTREEKGIIQNLNMAMESLIDIDEPLEEPEPDDELEAVTTARPVEAITDSIPVDPRYRIQDIMREERRYRRSISGRRRTDMIAESSLLSAVQNDGACNPILRSTSTALVRALYRENPAELRKLQQTAK